MLRNLLVKLIALFLIISPFVPLNLFGVRDLRGNSAMTPGLWLLSISITLLLTLILLIFFKWLKFDYLPILRSLIANFSKSLFLIPFTLLSISALVFKFKPHLIDSIIQLFQAKIFASGAIILNPKIPYAFIANQNLVNFNGELSSQYPPGYAAILSIGSFFNIPWAIDILLASLSALIIYKLTARIYDQLSAQIAAFLLAFSLYFQVLAVSYMNHIGCLFFLALAVYYFKFWEEKLDKTNDRKIILSVFYFSLALIIRPLTAIAVSLVFILPALKIIFKQKLFRQLLLSIAVTFPALIFWSWYNLNTTGSATLSGYIYLWSSSHSLGFHTTPWGDAFTLMNGIKNQIFNFSAINEYLFESLLPGLWPVGLYLLISKNLSTWDLRLLSGFLIIPFLHLFYWHNDNLLGPRFIYEGIIFLIPLTAHAISQVFRETDKLFYLKRFVVVALLVSLSAMLIIGIPGRLKIYALSMQSFKKDITKLAKVQNLKSPALIFVHTSFGDRIISKLKSAEPSAAKVETLYRFSDHCELSKLAEKLYQQKMPISENDFNDLKNSHVIKVANSSDTSLRLKDPSNIPADCLQELQYDASGFTLYAPHFNENPIDFKANLLFFRDLREHNVEVANLYPNYAYYVFDGMNFSELKF